jgi:hypothetical protein
MKTTDIFTINRSSRRINETIEKTFGRKLNLENFDLAQLEDARNKLRTQIHTVRSESGFNENLENDAYTQAQWMLDAIVSEIAQRETIATSEPVVEKAPPGAKAERMVKHIKKGYANDGKLTDKERSIAYATAWKQHNKDKNEDMNTTEAYINNAKDAVNLLADLRKQSKMAELGQGEPVRPNQLVNDLWDVMQWIEHNMKESMETESKNTGDDMSNLREGEIQQASAIVTAKTMVDRVGRWIEELSGMENDTLLTLGDSIRDEMGAEAAKTFISSCAPAIQQALQNLKDTREALSTSVRALTGEEQAADMLGGDAGGAPDDFGGDAEPDMMNTGGDEEPPMDDFAASEPGVGGMETAGREQRESINYQNRLLKVLAG